LASTDNDRRIAGVELNLASILEEEGQIDAALELLSDVEDLARSQQDWALLAYVNGAKGLAHARIGQFDRAESLLQRSLRSGKRRDDRMTELMARQNLGILHLYRGRHRRAVRWLNSALRSQSSSSHR
jgi:tetratricopeptide (TPR) repeat protein